MGSLRIFRPFSSRNYQLYFGGQIVSLIGTWMTQTASLWLAYKLTGSPFLLGVVAFASQIPSFLLGPIAGVWVDRVNRYRLLLLTQSLSLLQSAALAYFALRGTIDIHHLIILSLAQGLINAFDIPVRQALVVEFVPNKEHLGSAIALNSSMFNLSRLLGPALGGLIIARWGAGICYALDTASYGVVLLAIGSMRLTPRAHPHAHKHPWYEFCDGLKYAFGFPPIRALVVNISLISLCAFSFSTLAPVFARDIFHGDARTLGLLMSASAIGAVASSIYLGSRATVRGLGKIIAFGGFLAGTMLIAYALTPRLAFALPLLVLVGMGNVLIMASSNTILQTLVEDDKRGRVMSLYAMGLSGMTPIGSLIFGTIATRMNAPVAIIISGLMMLATTFYFWSQLPKIRKASAPLIAQVHPARPFHIEAE